MQSGKLLFGIFEVPSVAGHKLDCANLNIFPFPFDLARSNNNSIIDEQARFDERLQFTKITNTETVTVN